MRRYLCVMLLDEEIARWEYGFAILGARIAGEMRRHNLTEWPTLARADPDPNGWSWRLVFVWPDGHGSDQGVH